MTKGYDKLNTIYCELNHFSQDKFISYSEPEHEYEDNSYVIICLGNIYNQSELHKLAVKYNFNESIVNCGQLIAYLFTKLGTDMFMYLRGEFALIIWDKEAETLYGVRDHFGVESLYYIDETEQCYVANNKQLLGNCSINSFGLYERALQHYFTFQYVPGSMTLTEGCFKLTQGHFFIKKLGKPLQEHVYFRPELTPSYSEKANKVITIRNALYECVAERMSNDIPIGTLLSSGIDSTIITAIAQRINPNIKTFTIGFSEPGYSEIDSAAKTAEMLNIEHHNIIVTPERFIRVIPEMIFHLADPLADPSAVPLYIAYQEAKKQVNILLTGEGADEIFGGYEIYKEHQSLKIFQYVPQSLRQPLLELSSQLPEGVKGKSFLFRGLTPLSERYVGNAKIFEEKEKEKLLNHYSPDDESKQLVADYFNRINTYHPMEQMQYIDWHTWLPGNILLKANRLSRAINLQVRLPFVDQKVYNIAKQLKVEEKITKKLTKAILREAAEEMIPRHILHEKKRGFPVPLKKWLRNELFIWAKRNIANANTENYINKEYALKLLHEHVQYKHDHSRKLWTIIIFNIWFEMFIERENLTVKQWRFSVN